jgi:hypothetical protein
MQTQGTRGDTLGYMNCTGLFQTPRWGMGYQTPRWGMGYQTPRWGVSTYLVFMG